MKIKFAIITLLFVQSILGQQAYYNDVNLNLTGIALRDELATKIINTHTVILSYSDAREAIRITDLEPGQTNNVLLVYGFSSGLCPGSSSSDIDHRTRNKFDFGGGNNCEWNREHTYPQSLGTPDIGTAGPGADPHMLRSCDVDRNSTRGNRKFAAGSGNSGFTGVNWYPGDEWKGDIARMMMYMYLRYGNQCLPRNVGVGNAVANDSDMIDLFLQWNADDPVAQHEINRNDYLELTSNQYGQGNRNPFIDNPYLATRIWGGPEAEDIWGTLSNNENILVDLTIYPNPVKEVLHINKSDDLIIEEIVIYSTTGKLMRSITNNINLVTIEDLSSGLYFFKIRTNKGRLIKEILVK